MGSPAAAGASPAPPPGRCIHEQSRLASHFAADLSLIRAGADRVVRVVFAAISDALAAYEAVTIAGFVTFSTRTRDARRGRYPRTGEATDIAASRAPAFEAGNALRKAVNRSRE